MKFFKNPIILFIIVSLIHSIYKCILISSIYIDSKSTILITSLISSCISLFIIVLLLYLIFCLMFFVINFTKEIFVWIDYLLIIKDIFLILTLAEIVRFSFSIILLDVSTLVPDLNIESQLNLTDWFFLSSITSYLCTAIFSIFYIFRISHKIDTPFLKITTSLIFLSLIILVNYNIFM